MGLYEREVLTIIGQEVEIVLDPLSGSSLAVMVSIFGRSREAAGMRVALTREDAACLKDALSRILSADAGSADTA
jgi:hypothetical protein